MAVDVSKGISHLEHPEDLAISHGVGGINTALNVIDKFSERLGDQGQNLAADPQMVLSEKIDGAPSFYVGKDDQGKFFVAYKGSFERKTQALSYTLRDIQMQYENKGTLLDKMMTVWKVMKPIFKPSATVIQADMLFYSKASKNVD